MPQTADIARKLASLVDMGFERVEPTFTHGGPVDRNTYKSVTSRCAMGTAVSVTALGRSQAHTEEAVGWALAEMDRLIGIFNRYDTSSALTCLNDHGRLDDPPPELAFVVRHSLGVHEVSHGAFDITVAPLVDLFRNRLKVEASHPPTSAEIGEAMALVGSRRVELSRRSMRCARSGMAITLDGVAKGYIVDAMAAVLARRKIRRYLIDAGGDIRSGGRKEGGRPWTVAVRNPSDPGLFPGAIHLTDRAVATSGGYENYFDREKLFHHIVDAGTGMSPGACSSVSVAAPSAMAADALATAAFVLPPDEGLRFIERLPGCECLIIDRRGRSLSSRGWKATAPDTRETMEP
jgi:thiamine biosynthesis lipoprotein